MGNNLKGWNRAMKIRIRAGSFEFEGRLEEALAPKTCAKFKVLLPYHSKLIHVRWSGEGVWIPLGSANWGVPYENPTSHPAPGEFIFHPGGLSESEILLAYGGLSFSSKVGPLAGNHFLTITKGEDQLSALGNLTLWGGAQEIHFDQLVA